MPNRSFFVVCSVFLIMAFGVSESVWAQHHATKLPRPSENVYQKALHLFENKHYEAAQIHFERYLMSSHSLTASLEAKKYVLLCQLYLKNPSAEQDIEQFVLQNKQTTQAETIRRQVGDFFYEQGNFRKASQYLESLVHAKPSTEEELQLTFRLAYSYFKIARYKEAYRTFALLHNKENNYYAQANYYMSDIAYQFGEYDKAIIYAKNAKSDPDLVKSANDIVGASYFALNDCEQLSNYLSSIANEAHSVELLYLAGHCAYLKQSYASAYRWLNHYRLNSPTLNDSVAYQLLFAQYKLQKNDEFLNFSASRNWSAEFELPVLQLTALVYERVGLYKKAAITFERLAQLKPSLAAKASYSKLKMLYANDEYNKLIDESRLYSKQYPASPYLTQIIELVSNAIEQVQGTRAAIDYLKKNRSSLKNQSKFVALYKKAVKQAYNQRNFAEVFLLLDELDNIVSSSEKDFVNFYRAEVNFHTGRTDEAIKFYSQIAPTSVYYANSLYARGTAYYNKSDDNELPRKKALDFLTQYLDRSRYEQLSKAKIADAYAQIGNIYADTKQYKEAEIIFMRALSMTESEKDFIYYSLGQIYREQKQYEKAFQEFDKVLQFENSVYAERAHYKKAETYQQKGDLEQAFAYLDSFIKKYPQSSYQPLALLSRGSLYASKNHFEEAKDDFLAVIYNYPSSNAAPAAMESLKGLKEDAIVAIPNFDEILSRYNRYHQSSTPATNVAHLSNIEQAIATEFKKSENLYNTGQYALAVANLRKLATNKDLAQTPYYDKVHYYLGLAYAQTGENTSALENLKRIDGGLKLPAMLAMGNIEFDRGNYNNALFQYTRLAQSSTDEAFKVRAWQGLLKTYFEMQDYKTAQDYVALVKTKDGYYDRDFVQLYTHKLEAAKGNIEPAIEGFEKMGRSKQTNSVYAAEALYELANLLYELGSKDAAKAVIDNLRKEFAVQMQKNMKKKVDNLAMRLR